MADKHPAEVLADFPPEHRDGLWLAAVLAMLRRIPALEAGLKRANDQAEHFEREWYLRGDRLEDLEAERDQLRAELAARKEADTRSTIAAWDQIKRLQGEAYVLRDLLAEARAVLDTITGTDQEDGGAALSKLTAAIGVALDPTRCEAQQMYITEASKEAP